MTYEEGSSHNMGGNQKRIILRKYDCLCNEEWKLAT